MHPRNIHRNGYDLSALAQAIPSLSKYLQTNPAGKQTIDFADPYAVKLLNAALLKHHYQIQQWDLPQGYLCPPVPGRADYIHHVADLLAESNNGVIPTGNSVRGFDIGTGANLIYPILGRQIYHWRFVGTDVDKSAVKAANLIQSANINLIKPIEIRLQTHTKQLFAGVVNDQERFAFSVCNPPFHASEQAANLGSNRKTANLHRHQQKRRGNSNPVVNQTTDKAPKPLNFAGKNHELWCDGGEVGFILRMIEQSVEYQQQIGWFTSLVSKKDSLPPLYKKLDSLELAEYRTVKMGQGNKQSRFLAWRF